MYKLVYAPEIEQSNVNYLYKDKKVHIRLNRFGYKNQVISGFENKLSFLTTFVIVYYVHQFEYIKKAYQEDSDELLTQMIRHFEACSDEYAKIKRIISEKLKISDLEFSIVPLRYKRLKNTVDRLGDCHNLDVDVFFGNKLDTFMIYFNISDLREFLFDDAYYLEYVKDKLVVNNDKFIKKHSKVVAEAESLNVKLW